MTEIAPDQPTRLWFRLTASFATIRAATVQEPAWLDYPGPDGIRIQFRAKTLPPPESDEYSGFHDCIGIAQMHYPAPRKTIEALLHGAVQTIRYGDEEVWDDDNIPATVWETIKSVTPKLRQSLTHTYHLFRWRYDHPGGASPFSHDWLQWSVDGTDWNDLPSKDFHPFEWDMFELAFTDEHARVLKALLDQGIAEPRAHEMFREAWGQRLENTRSALVMGMAAAEVGLKSFIAKRFPQVAWLIVKSPSPDLLRTLTSFLPTIIEPEAKQFFFATTTDKQAYQDEVLRSLQNGVTRRNEIVHDPEEGQAPELSFVSRTLNAVNDFLYLLDHHDRYAWAQEHIRRDVRDAWRSGQPAPEKPKLYRRSTPHPS